CRRRTERRWWVSRMRPTRWMAWRTPFRVWVLASMEQDPRYRYRRGPTRSRQGATRSQEGHLLYQLYEAQQAALYPLRLGAGLTSAAVDLLPARWTDTRLFRTQSAWCQMVMHTRITHTRPAFGIDNVLTAGGKVAVKEEPVLTTPFARLIH